MLAPFLTNRGCGKMTNKSKPKILVTGGTGFLGQKVVPLLRENFQVYVMSRSGNSEVQGDLRKWNAGLDIETLKAEKFDIFLHMAGLYDLTATHEECFHHNITGTGTALKVASLLNIPVFMNTSSVAAAVNSKLASVKPYDLNFSSAFPDPYSESKALAEKTIQNWNHEFRLKVNFRLGVLVGDTVSGEIQRIDGPYHAPVAFDRLKKVVEAFPSLLPLPGTAGRTLPLVPVDKAAEAIAKFCDWSLNPENTSYRSFHITPKHGLDIEDLYKSTLENRNIRHKGIKLVDKVPETLLKTVSELALKFPQEELNYLLHFPKYDASDTEAVLGADWCPEFKDYEAIFWRGYETYISHRRD
ncbi:SDR family oxidoreductase [Bdellovibrio sp. HCB185ZH]|uniref:SDR family oxidoreductase n=1 Tax=Bdellovibrio sp. HCB185ZH TaxID=3394235 RepID=UPI0039A6E77F